MAGYAEIESILRENNLITYFSLFQEAQLTDNELQFVEDAHLKEMGIPLGPRLKICSALRARGYSSSARPPKPIALNKSRLPPVSAPVRSTSETPFSQPQRTGSNPEVPNSFGHPRTTPEAVGPSQIFPSAAIPPGFAPTIQPFGQTRSSGLDSCTCYQVPCTCSRPFGSTPASNLGSILEFSAFGRSGGSVFSPFPATTPASTLFSSPGVFSSTYSPFPSDPWNDKTWQAPTASEQDKLKQEQIKQEQLKQEQLKQEQLKQEQFKQEQAKQEQQRQEQQRQEQQRLEQQRLEQQRQEQKLEQQRLEQQRLEQQRLEQQRLEQQKLEQQKLEQKREQQRLEQQWMEQQKLEQQRQAEQKFSTVQKNGEKRKQDESTKSEVKTKKEKELPQPSHAAIEDRNRPAVITGNAFDLLDHESDEEQTDKGKQKEDAPTKKEPKPKDAKKAQAASTPAPVPAASAVASKPKCECGQIVHPSVLNPITEFQMQDRQAHLTSKRHQTYLQQQEALARKEKEAKLKQEKADAQKAKEDAQRAKEEAQRAIEEAQRLIEEAQKAEEAEAKAREGGGKKKAGKKVKGKPTKEKKVEEQPPEVSNVVDGKTKLSSAKDAELKRKKQLASEMQQEANQLYNQGLYAKAVDRYTDGINLNPNSAVLYSNRAQAETKCYQYERAVNDCLKAIELDPGFAKSYHRASACYVKLGDLTKAKFMLAQCKSACSATNDKKDETPFHIKLVADLEAALMSVKKFMQEKMYKEAIDLLQNKITSQMPEAFSSHYLLAEAYIMTGNFIAAHDVAHKFMIKYPRLSDTRILESLFAYYNEAKLEKAADILKSVLADDKDNTRASKLLDKIQKIDILKKTAEELHLRKNYQKAAQGFGQALSIDRENKHVTATLLFLRGSVYFNLAQYGEAKRDLDESLELWSSFLRARKLRASVNEKLGNNQAVIDDCRAILDDEWDDRINDMMKAAKQNKPTQDFKGYYATLSIPLDANMEDITKSYKRLALRYHPEKWSNSTDDKRSEAEAQFRAVAVAYEVLSDPAKRIKYDNCDAEGKIKCECGRHSIDCYLDLR